jgi:hypothetical protein
MYLAMLDCATSNPRLSSSPWIRGAPPKRILHAHLPDQHAQIRLDLRPPFRAARPPAPVAVKAGTMPAHERLRLDDRENLQDRRKPSIQLAQEPTIIVGKPDPALNLTPQNDQLMSEN